MGNNSKERLLNLVSRTTGIPLLRLVFGQFILARCVCGCPWFDETFRVCVSLYLLYHTTSFATTTGGERSREADRVRVWQAINRTTNQSINGGQKSGLPLGNAGRFVL